MNTLTIGDLKNIHACIDERLKSLEKNPTTDGEFMMLEQLADKVLELKWDRINT